LKIKKQIDLIWKLIKNLSLRLVLHYSTLIKNWSSFYLAINQNMAFTKTNKKDHRVLIEWHYLSILSCKKLRGCLAWEALQAKRPKQLIFFYYYCLRLSYLGGSFKFKIRNCLFKCVFFFSSSCCLFCHSSVLLKVGSSWWDFLPFIVGKLNWFLIIYLYRATFKL